LKRLMYLALLTAFLSAGCGYHARGRETNLPPEIHSLAISIFANRTDETGIETDVTRALVEKFISSKRLTVATQDSADALLTGTVRNFVATPVAVTSATQVSTEYRATLTVEYSFQAVKDGKVLYREAISDWRNYPVVTDLNTTEQYKREAIRAISALLAERIHELILGGF
jgi:outer membrane lipopolysaccharide assembly protein LptE/RlpB